MQKSKIKYSIFFFNRLILKKYNLLNYYQVKNLLKNIDLTFQIIFTDSAELNKILLVNLLLFFENLTGFKGQFKNLKTVFFSKKKHLILSLSINLSRYYL